MLSTITQQRSTKHEDDAAPLADTICAPPTISILCSAVVPFVSVDLDCQLMTDIAVADPGLS